MKAADLQAEREYEEDLVYWESAQLMGHAITDKPKLKERKNDRKCGID